MRIFNVFFCLALCFQEWICVTSAEDGKRGPTCLGRPCSTNKDCVSEECTDICGRGHCECANGGRPWLNAKCSGTYSPPSDAANDEEASPTRKPPVVTTRPTAIPAITAKKPSPAQISAAALAPPMILKP
ncbi:uncharacterized protein LOC129602069 [Paramacrobiotus metropolitanus]|uniref:uncharacterized protein LOC129602069 n=1 Tax=Paramacrobiotus metropolitanus TaxID=2943436 RepID=UPI002445A93C|nr:uncharacterized protein LOC129602069 [Paramacrobiotus metropolitanus]